jgi:hypothetical protein
LHLLSKLTKTAEVKELRQSGDLPFDVQTHDFAPPPHDGFALSVVKYFPIMRRENHSKVTISWNSNEKTGRLLMASLF